jgi:error-prone DNA polymerase
MVNPFIRRRKGIEPVVYEHDDLKPILHDTYGVILFQEQVLEVAHTFAGMSLQEADDFRSLMSKFRSAIEMEGMRDRFVGGATGRGVDAETANSVFDKVAKFVGYGFCRSHAAAFAKTVYHSAWLKCHHPAAFMAAIMQHRPGMYNLTTLEQESRRFGVPILPPDINRSGVRYDLERTPDGKLAIRKPLASVTELSAADAKMIVLARLAGPFTGIADLYTRVSLSRDVLDNLARSGALDEIAEASPDKGEMSGSREGQEKVSAREYTSSRSALWQVGLLARRLGPAGRERPPSLLELPAIDEIDIPELPPLTELERLRWDYQGHGSARRHPMTLLRRTLNDLEIRPIETIARFTRSHLRSRSHPLVLTLAGMVILRQMPPTAKGVMFVTLEDETGYVQCIMQIPVRERFEEELRHPALIVRGEVQIAGNWRGLVAREVWRLEENVKNRSMKYEGRMWEGMKYEV